MKAAAIILVVLCIAALAGVGYLYMTANMTVIATGVSAVEASAQPEMFDSLKKQAESGNLIGTRFSGGGIGKAEDHVFYTYTVRLKNDCFIDADVVELQVTPLGGDALQTGGTAAQSLKAHATGDFQTTILTKKDMHNVREITVTWYFWGIPFRTKTTAGK